MFYQHTENTAWLPKGTQGVFYEVGYVDQVHANLCTNASESMINHFWGKSFATMAKNPRNIIEGIAPNHREYSNAMVSPDTIQIILKDKGPFIMALPLRYGASHSVVVTGCANDQVIYNDPLTGSHKMIGMDTLKDLLKEQTGRIEIAIPILANKSGLMSKVKPILTDPPLNIIPKNYQSFFSLDKMNDPREAILDFLKDYANGSLSGQDRLNHG